MADFLKYLSNQFTVLKQAFRNSLKKQKHFMQTLAR